MARRGSRKVRTGCITCKVRKVKCDETKPTCVRCDRAGITCNGYPQPQHVHAVQRHSVVSRVSRPSSPLSSRPLCLVPLTSKQSLYFDVYRYKVAPKLPDREFWSRTVQREGIFDECIRDTIIALGAMSLALDQEAATHKADDRNVDIRDEDGRAEQAPTVHSTVLQTNFREARTHYASGISAFRRRLAASPGAPTSPSSMTSATTTMTTTTTTTQQQASKLMTPRSIFIATYLFVMFERLQGNLKGADQLLIHGIYLLRQHLAVFKKRQSSNLPRGLTSSLAAKIDDGGLLEAERTFVHMALVNPSGQRISWSGAATPEEKQKEDEEIALQVVHASVPSMQLSIEQLLIEWDLFISRSGLWIFRFVPNMDFLDPRMDEGSEIRKGVLDTLRKWRLAFETKIQACKRDIQGAEEEGAAAESQSTALCATLETALAFQKLCFACFNCLYDTTEMAWDHFEEDMMSAIDTIETTGEDTGDSPTLPRFESLSFSMVHPLYFVVQKCRHAQTRQRALAMLRFIASEKDDTWATKLLLAGCEAHVKAEEEGRDEVTGLIPVEKRFSFTQYSLTSDRAKIVIKMRSAIPTSTGKHLVKVEVIRSN